MWPLNEMIDETYTVYFRFCAEAGCPRLRPRRSTATWHEEDGYLLQGSGHDLYEKRVTIAEARRLCAADPQCTSFCANCATAACKAEPASLAVYFKSYDSAREMVGRQEAGVLPRWRSFMLPEDDGGACDELPPDGAATPPRRCVQRISEGATWRVALGYLVARSGADLFERTVTIAEAKLVCAAEPKCTSFTVNCATAGCEAEPTVYFKSYDVPQKHIDGRPATPQPAGAAGWHSFYVDAAEREEVCEEEDGGAALAGRG